MAHAPSPTLTPRERARLAHILARLASPFESERAAAGLLATAFIEKHGLTWSDLAVLPASGDSRKEAPGKPATDRRRGVSRFWQGYCRRRAAPAAPTLSRFA